MFIALPFPCYQKQDRAGTSWEWSGRCGHMRQIYLKYEITPRLESTHSRDGYGHACKKRIACQLKGQSWGCVLFHPRVFGWWWAAWPRGSLLRGRCALGCAPWGHTLVAHNAHFYDRFITRRPRPDNARPAGARFNFLLGSSSNHWHPCISYQHCSCVLLHLPACIPITIIACFHTVTVRHVND